MRTMLPHELQIATLSKKYATTPLTTLHRHLNEDLLEYYFNQLNKQSSVGVDGQSWTDYEKRLSDRLPELISLAKSGRYRAPHIRRVYIPKGDGGQRPLGIPTVEDKLLQKGVQSILSPIYEQEFKDCSLGFREGRSQHDALEYMRHRIHNEGCRVIIDADIKSYFDSIDHALLREFIERRVRDGVIIRLLGKWLNAGILEEKELRYPTEGTPQGGVISPLLANIFLHYVLDVWFTEEVQPLLHNHSFMVRFADDFVMGFVDAEDAQRVMAELPKRMARFKLKLNMSKTKVVNLNTGTRGRCSFDFLGFTHYVGRDRHGNGILQRKTSKSRLRRSIKKTSAWIKENRHEQLSTILKGLNKRLLGHYNYYGITFNSSGINNYFYQVVRSLQKWLQRRGGRGRWNWDRMNDLLRSGAIEKPRIMVNSFQ